MSFAAVASAPPKERRDALVVAHMGLVKRIAASVKLNIPEPSLLVATPGGPSGRRRRFHMRVLLLLRPTKGDDEAGAELIIELDAQACMILRRTPAKIAKLMCDAIDAAFASRATVTHVAILQEPNTK